MTLKAIVSFVLFAVLLPLPGYCQPLHKAKHQVKAHAAKTPAEKSPFSGTTLEEHVIEYNIRLMSANMDAELYRSAMGTLDTLAADSPEYIQNQVDGAKAQVEFVEDLAIAQRMVRIISREPRVNSLYYFGKPYNVADVFPSTFTNAVRAKIITMPLQRRLYTGN